MPRTRIVLAVQCSFCTMRFCSYAEPSVYLKVGRQNAMQQANHDGNDDTITGFSSLSWPQNL